MLYFLGEGSYNKGGGKYMKVIPSAQCGKKKKGGHKICKDLYVIYIYIVLR